MEGKVRETSGPSPPLQCKDSGCRLPHPIDEVLGIEPRALLMLNKCSPNSANPKAIILSFGILKVCCEGHSISDLDPENVSYSSSRFRLWFYSFTTAAAACAIIPTGAASLPSSQGDEKEMVLCYQCGPGQSNNSGLE